MRLIYHVVCRREREGIRGSFPSDLVCKASGGRRREKILKEILWDNFRWEIFCLLV